MKSFSLALAVSLLASPALAQSAPGWSYGYVPSAAEWNNAFASKQNVLNLPSFPANQVLTTTGGNTLASVPKSGNGSAIASTSGTLTAGSCATFDSFGNIVQLMYSGVTYPCYTYGSSPVFNLMTATTVATGSGGLVLFDSSVLTGVASAAQYAAGNSYSVITPASFQIAEQPNLIASASSVSVNLLTHVNNLLYLTSNIGTLSFTGCVVGQPYNIYVVQGSGSNTITWPSSVDWGAAGTPTLTATAGKMDIVTMICTAGTSLLTPQYAASIQKGFTVPH